MSITAYPSTLPGPQPGAYTPPLRRAASSLPGPLQQRSRQWDLSGGQRTHTFIYTAEQMGAWRTWWRDTLLQGRRWFTLNLPGYEGMTPRVVRYLEVSQSLIGAGVYAVEARLELREANKLGPPGPPTDEFYASVHTLMMPLDTTTPLINYAPAGGIIGRAGSVPPPPFGAGAGPFEGVGYLQGGAGNPSWIGPLLTTYYDDWTFDCYVNYLGTTHSQNAGMLTLQNNLQLNLDCTPGDGGNGTLTYNLSGITQWSSSVLSTGWQHIQLESKLIAPSTRRARIWIGGTRVMDGVALGIGSAIYATGLGPRGGTNSGSGFANVPFPVSCWRLTLNANRNWDDATFTPPASLNLYLP